MLGFLFNFLLLAAEVGEAAHSESGWGKFVHTWNTYANYPGFEAWRFFNLAVFVAIMVYLLKKPLSNAFKTRREKIRAELIKAEEEKQAALEKLGAAETKLSNLDAESKQILEHAKHEAEAEKSRILEQTTAQTTKMREQAKSEVERKNKQVQMKLRRFSAEESIRLAEEKIKNQMNEEKDAQLVRNNIQSIGGLS